MRTGTTRPPGSTGRTATRPVVLYCAKGHEIGQGLTTTLRVLGVDACFLEGGMQGWLEAGRPTAPIDGR